MQDLQMAGRKILITGAARGLGESFARALVAAGARVALSDVLHDRGQALARELGGAARYVPLDLADPSSIHAGVAEASTQLGGLDGLINNGAITNSGGVPAEEIPVEVWDRVMAVNVRGAWLAAVAARPFLAASGSGRIVNIASDTALWGAPRLLAYVTSKGALIAMTRTLAREFGADGITVNAVAPGLTLGEATEYIAAERHAQYVQGRAIARAQVPADVTAAVSFLLAHGSGFVTGQLLPVNGGFVMS